MYDVSQCEHTIQANCPGRYGARSSLRSCRFCYLILVGVVLCLFPGCTAKLLNRVLPAPPTPTLTLTNKAPTVAVQTPSATSVLTATSIATLTVTATMSSSVDAASVGEALTSLSSEGIITYTVQRGDTLSKLAQRYGTTVEAIMEANGLTDRNKIKAGQILRIPATTTPVPTPSDTAAPALLMTLTAMAQPTGTHTPSEQQTARRRSGARSLSVWDILIWIDDHRGLALSVTLPAMLLAGALAFFIFRRGSTAHSPFMPPPAAIAAATGSRGSTNPPAAGTAYLETRLNATSAVLYYPLTQSVTSIGRDPGNTIVIDQRFADQNTVSRQHIQIARSGDCFIAKDLGSANGLLINQRRSRENVLHDGAMLSIGKTQFVFRRNQPGGIP